METVSKYIENWSEDICQQLMQLQDKCCLYKWHNPEEHQDVVWVGGHFAWKDLDGEGIVIQSRLFEEYNKYHEYLSVLLSKQPPRVTEDLKNAKQTVLSVVKQEGDFLFDDNVSPHFERAITSVKAQAGLVKRLYDGSKAGVIVAPDTNALLYNTEMEKWTFEGIEKFRIALLPTVLAELDELKVSHRNTDVREKSKKLIRKIKEYRRRGAITSGVIVVAGKVEIVALAVEPNFDDMPSWLDRNNRDDRILASFLELMRWNPDSRCILVTGDINMQNKAEYSRIPFCEPPEVEGEMGSSLRLTLAQN